MEGCRGINQAKRYNCPFKRPIASMESHFPFIAFYNSYQMIYMIEIYLGINVYLLERIKKVGYQKKWIFILLCNIVESLKVST